MKHILILLAGLFVVGESFALPPCPTYGYFDNCYGTGTWAASGGKYVGGWKANQRHGQGTFTWSNGNKYVGGYKYGKKHGQGTFTSANGDKYVGEYKYGKKHSQGTYTWADGNKYVGEYKYGKKHGQGTFTSANGDKYFGEYDYGKKHGQGTFTSANGDKYVGEHKYGKKHGQGTYTWADGNKYVGGWKASQRHGQGTFTSANGDKYVGEWKDAKKHGQGTFTSANGDKYFGEWKDAKKHGQGTYTWADGQVYVGGWRESPWEGIQYSPSGQVQGAYSNGKWCGGCTPTARQMAIVGEPPPMPGLKPFIDEGYVIWKDNSHGFKYLSPNAGGRLYSYDPHPSAFDMGDQPFFDQDKRNYSYTDPSNFKYPKENYGLNLAYTGYYKNNYYNNGWKISNPEHPQHYRYKWVKKQQDDNRQWYEQQVAQIRTKFNKGEITESKRKELQDKAREEYQKNTRKWNYMADERGYDVPWYVDAQN